MNARRRAELTAKVWQARAGNCAYSDFRKLLEAYGFTYAYTSGSHVFYKHPELGTFDSQQHNGKAKRYQIEQFFRLIHRD